MLYQLKKRLFFLLSICFIGSILCSNVSFASSMTTQAPKAKLNVTNLNLTKGSSYDLRVYNTLSAYKIKYRTSDKNVVSIKKSTNYDNLIQLSGDNVGTSTVTVTIRNVGKTIAVLKCNVNVKPSAISIKFSRKKYSIFIGKDKRIKPIVKPITSSETPTFRSSDENIFKVNGKGKISGIAAGKATLYATLSDGQEASCTITIKDKTKPSNPQNVGPFATVTPSSSPSPSPVATIEPPKPEGENTKPHKHISNI